MLFRNLRCVCWNIIRSHSTSVVCAQSEKDVATLEPWLLREMDACISNIFLNQDADVFVQLFNLILNENISGRAETWGIVRWGWAIWLRHIMIFLVFIVITISLTTIQGILSILFPVFTQKYGVVSITEDTCNVMTV